MNDDTVKQVQVWAIIISALCVLYLNRRLFLGR